MEKKRVESQGSIGQTTQTGVQTRKTSFELSTQNIMLELCGVVLAVGTQIPSHLTTMEVALLIKSVKFHHLLNRKHNRAGTWRTPDRP